MAVPPARRRSFLSLEQSSCGVEDGSSSGSAGSSSRALLTKHRSFTGFFRDGTPTRIGGSAPVVPSTLQQQLKLWRQLSARRVLMAAGILALTFFAGSRWCSSSTAGRNTNRIRTGVYRNDSHGGSLAAGGLPPEPQDRPYYDLVVAVLVVGGDSEESQAEIARVRRVYARYGSGIVPGGGPADAAPLTFKVIFVVGRAGLPEGVEPGEAGLLLGDFYHVDVREGYRYLSDKTKAMTGLADHFR